MWGRRPAKGHCGEETWAALEMELWEEPPEHPDRQPGQKRYGQVLGGVRLLRSRPGTPRGGGKR